MIVTIGISSFVERKYAGLAIPGLMACAGLVICFATYANAQQAGPLKPPPATASAPAPTPKAGPVLKDSTSPAKAGPALSHSLGPLPIPVEEAIQKFAAREAAFKEARGNYTYTQTVDVKDYGPAGEEGGHFHEVRDITFTPEGKRFENVTFAPGGTTLFLTMTPEDMSDLKNIQPFVLLPEDLPKYDIKYVTHEPVDELSAYVFDVTPKQVEKGKSYFKGRIWVDDQGFNIVKTYGEAVHGIKMKKNGDGQLFPHFTTYRENIAADFWFPTYTHADDVLHFKQGDVRLVMTVKYSNYKYFGVKIKIGTAKTDKPDQEEEEPER